MITVSFHSHWCLEAVKTQRWILNSGQIKPKQYQQHVGEVTFQISVRILLQYISATK